MMEEDLTEIQEENVIQEDHKGNEVVAKKSPLRTNGKFRNLVMLSEWMIDSPPDFPDKWTVTVCPVGKRCTVVAARGSTKAFARNGYPWLHHDFPSSLPGGSKGKKSSGGKQNCILDCIYCERDRTFFVLDLILWNGVSFFGCESQFRHFWLTSKFKEDGISNDDVKAKSGFSKESDGNRFSSYKLKLLPKSDSSLASITRELDKFERELNEETGGREHVSTPEDKSGQNDKQRKGSDTDNWRDKKTHEKTHEKTHASFASSSPVNETSASSCCSRPSSRRVEIDGLLFFHREGLYASGVTPLVLWLKPFMLSKVLSCEALDTNETLDQNDKSISTTNE